MGKLGNNSRQITKETFVSNFPETSEKILINFIIISGKVEVSHRNFVETMRKLEILRDYEDIFDTILQNILKRRIHLRNMFGHG